MPALVESEEEDDEDSDSKDPLPEKLQNSMVTKHHDAVPSDPFCRTASIPLSSDNHTALCYSAELCELTPLNR